MKNFTVEAPFWDRFPDAEIYIMTLENIDNRIDESKDPYFAKLLADGKKQAETFLIEPTFSQNPVVAQWREAFTTFKTKKGARSSIESLMKRVDQDRTFNPINPLVDIYNSISLRYALPLGGEDIEKISGHLRLTETQGGDSFFPLGAETDAPTLAGEVCYLDDEGAVCRCLNWREAKRTMLTENTKQAFLIIETVNSEQAARAELAIKDLQSLCQDYFGQEGKIQKLTIDNPSVQIA